MNDLRPIRQQVIDAAQIVFCFVPYTDSLLCILRRGETESASINGDALKPVYIIEMQDGKWNLIGTHAAGS